MAMTKEQAEQQFYTNAVGARQQAYAYDSNSSTLGPVQQAAHNYYQTNGTNGGSQLLGTAGQASRVWDGAEFDPFDPNKIESLNIDLETLAGLWAAKYGSKWVEDAVFAEGREADKFWHHAFKRLRLRDKFEHYANWSRLKEGV